MNYFTERPWACRCGCGYDKIDQLLVNRLNLARADAGIPFVINSACRCKAYNKRVGGKSTSAHLMGEAVDVAAVTSQQKFLIVRALLRQGFCRIGVGETFIHADISMQLPQNVIWTYD